MKYEALYERACACGKAQAPELPTTPAGPESVKLGGCRPYLKIERDTPRFQACQVIAERVGAVNDPKKAYEILREAAGHEVAERFGVMTLDTHLRLRGLAETGAGETDSVMAPKVPTLQVAIADSAAAAVIYHVHPAASARPSEADIEVTREFARAFDEVGILLLDHIIVATGSKPGFYSFLDSMPSAFDGTGERVGKVGEAVARDFDTDRAAVQHAKSVGATYFFKEQGDNGRLFVFARAPMGTHGWERTLVYFERGRWHLDKTTERRGSLPPGAKAIR